MSSQQHVLLFLGRGKCSPDGSHCECLSGYSGDDCSLDENNFIGNTWHFLSRNPGGTFTARASHASVYNDPRDSLFVYGGFDLNFILGDLIVYKFQESEWSAFDYEKAEFLSDNSTAMNSQSKFNVKKSILNFASDETRPPPLYGHAMENAQDGFVIYGGVGPAGLSNELWYFNITTSTFSKKAGESSWTPPALSEHSLTLAEGYLYAFGGSTLHGKFSREMFRISETDLDQWEPVEPRGTKVTDLRVTGHSMVYSEQCR